MDIETSLRVLTLLCDTLNTPVDIDETLERITGMTGVLMETRQTAILLRDDDRNELIVRTRAGIAAPGLQTGHPLAVNARLKHILLRMNSMRQIGTIESGIEGIGFPILVTPLRVKGERVGLLITGSLFPGRTSFDGLRRRLFSLIAAFSSLILENAKAGDYLRQQFAQRSAELLEANRLAAAGGTRSAEEHLMVSSLKNPTKVVRLLAVSFYKELARAGFSPGHITTAAAELLDCITRQETVAAVSAPPRPLRGPDQIES